MDYAQRTGDRTISTRFDEILDASESTEAREIPYGLGCGGVIDVLMEPAALPEANALLLALEAAVGGETLYVATVLPSSAPGNMPFARVVAREDGSVIFASSHLDQEQRTHLASLARGTIAAGTTSISIGDGMREVYCEPLLPPQRLVIFGAGDDVRPLVSMAHLLGWHVAVADGRAWLAQAGRFPGAEQVLVRKTTPPIWIS